MTLVTLVYTKWKMSNCISCGRGDSSGQSMVSCDKCNRIFCQDCSLLTATEMRSAILKKRNMIFLCTPCRGLYDEYLQADSLRGVIAEVVSEVLPDIVKNVFTEQISRIDSRIGGVEASVQNLRDSNIELVRLLTSKVRISGDVSSSSAIGGESTTLGAYHCPPVGRDGHLRVDHSLGEDGKARVPLRMAPGTEGSSTSDGVRRHVDTLPSKPVTHVGALGENKRKNAVRQQRIPSMGDNDYISGRSSADCIPEDTEGYKEVRYKKRKSRINFGTCEGVQGFSGVERRIWIYVGRVQPEVASEAIVDFLEKKCPGRKFTCERLKSRSPNGSFRVGADYDLRDKLLEGSFWPTGVVYRRYWLYASNDGSQRTVRGFRSLSPGVVAT